MSNLKIAVISDIHLGHKRNNTAEIIAALNVALPDNSETGELNIIFLAGDIFDRLLNLPNDDVIEIDLWIHRLFCICAKYDIYLRVLEGTPSHDNFQSKRFETIAQITKTSVNFSYAKTLSIEYIPRFGINVLYVPDEWDVTTTRTLDQVKSLLLSKGLEKVDYAIMHGQFDYQMPSHLTKIPVHDSVAYLDIVSKYIFIGHVHIHSSLDRIVAQGSFDRLSHGEEGPKGHVRAEISDESMQWYFIENKLARIYKTIDCSNMELQSALEFIKDEVGLLPVNSCVRISGQPKHQIFDNMNQLIALYPTIVWTKLVKIETNEITEINDRVDDIHNSITITKDNIVALIMSRVNETTFDSSVLLRSEQLLSAVI